MKKTDRFQVLTDLDNLEASIRLLRRELIIVALNCRASASRLSKCRNTQSRSLSEPKAYIALESCFWGGGGLIKNEQFT
jgi:hypothetical protein